MYIYLLIPLNHQLLSSIIIINYYVTLELSPGFGMAIPQQPANPCMPLSYSFSSHYSFVYSAYSVHSVLLFNISVLFQTGFPPVR